MFDVFYIGSINKNYYKIKEKIPTLKLVNDFEIAQTQSLTKMFWCIFDDLCVLDEFDFSFIPELWDRQYIHVFKNKDTYDGVILCPKNAEVSQKEIDYRFFLNKKEIDIIASTPKPYDLFEIDTYDEYQDALANSTTEMFWMSSRNIKVDTDVINEFYISHHNSIDRKQNHAFIHHEIDEFLKNGLFLCSKHTPLTKREVEYRFPVNRKEWDIIASALKQYDVVFISYNEPNAEENYQNLLKKVPDAKRVHDVTGIHQAHIEAAKMCRTDMIWIVDGDAQIIEDFDFDYQVHRWEKDIVHVWRSQNPINGLEYGYGGVKLFPRNMTINMDTTKPDMTTSISSKFKVVEQVSNITAFNTGPFEAWKSAFRECVKLASRTINRQQDDETESRLEIWKTVGADKQYGEYAIKGAIQGHEYGIKYKDNADALRFINDFNWLQKKFKEP